jgi:transposase-like protein
MSGKYPKYSPEFREEAAKMVVEGSRAIAQVAREYGLSETTLGNWVRAYRKPMPATSRRWNCRNGRDCGN